MCEVEFFIIKVCLIEGSEELSVDVIRVERGELLRINNFYYQKIIDLYVYLKGVEMMDYDLKLYFLVYVILGVSDYVVIKIFEKFCVGFFGE